MAVQPPNRTIILVGMMGAGKSTIGKALAALMGTKFVDLDRELEERCGVSIPHIFETEGEAGFRCRETRLLQEYASCDRRRSRYPRRKPRNTESVSGCRGSP